MDETHSLIVACVRDGLTIDQAAQEAKIPVGTLRRWLTTGRKYPDGKWGALARSVDAHRLTVPEQTTGERLAEIEAIADMRDDPSEGERARFGLARALARKIDWCEATPTGAAAMAMANLSKQYREVLEELTPASGGDYRELVEALTGGAEREYHLTLESIANGELEGDAARDAARRVLDEALP